MVMSDPMGLGAEALAEAKAWLRVAGTDEDALIGRLVGGSALLCEQFIGRALIVRTHREILPAAGGWRRLSAAPVTAITLVETLAPDAPLDPSAYAIDIDASGEGWVRTTDPAARIRVNYQAGLAPDWPGLPEPLRQGVVRLVSHLHAHREGPGQEGPPAAVTALWRPWRRLRLAGEAACSNG